MLEFLNPLLSTLSMVADQRIPTNPALILRNVESLLLRQTFEVGCFLARSCSLTFVYH